MYMSSHSLFVFFMVFQLTTFIYSSQNIHQKIIEQHAQSWTEKYITDASEKETETIIDLLLLSYSIIKASCKMIIAKFTIQEEILKIYTPSFIDSWHDNLQINANDTTKLELALSKIKESQAELKQIYIKFQKLIPLIIKINPQPTQTLISDLKDCIIAWGKEQQIVTEELVEIQNEFSHATATISDIKILFDTVSQSAELKHTYLKDTASFFAKTYKDIDHVIDHLTKNRIQNIFKIENFFEYFFKEYYSMIYETLSSSQKESALIIATTNEKIPLPDAFFA